jgi:hypothetical protein
MRSRQRRKLDIFKLGSSFRRRPTSLASSLWDSWSNVYMYTSLDTNLLTRCLADVGDAIAVCDYGSFVKSIAIQFEKRDVTGIDRVILTGIYSVEASHSAQSQGSRKVLFKEEHSDVAIAFA